MFDSEGDETDDFDDAAYFVIKEAEDKWWTVPKSNLEPVQLQ